MHRLKTLATALVVALVVITCVDYAASAATGGTFVLGHLNKAGKVTALKRTGSGPALSLTTSSSAAPLQVNGAGRVANLNADRVDGLDSRVLRNHSYVFTKTVSLATDDVEGLVPVPVGTYEFSYSAFLGGAENGWAYCQIVRAPASGSATFVGISQVQAGAYTPGLTGAGVLVKGAGDRVWLDCGAQNAFTTRTTIPIQLVLTPTSVVSSSTLPDVESSSRLAGR